MIIAIASDHRGLHAKVHLVPALTGAGHKVEDFGVHTSTACDYPDLALPACLSIMNKKVDRAILIDGSGIGMSIVANKLPGIRAAVCHDELTAEISRRYNDANALCLAADLLGEELIKRIVKVWLTTDFELGRHSRRVEKIGLWEDCVFGQRGNVSTLLESFIAKKAAES